MNRMRMIIPYAHTRTVCEDPRHEGIIYTLNGKLSNWGIYGIFAPSRYILPGVWFQWDIPIFLQFVELDRSRHLGLPQGPAGRGQGDDASQHLGQNQSNHNIFGNSRLPKMSRGQENTTGYRYLGTELTLLSARALDEFLDDARVTCNQKNRIGVLLGSLETAD
jgi:hypothetical protein